MLLRVECNDHRKIEQYQNGPVWQADGHGQPQRAHQASLQRGPGGAAQRSKAVLQAVAVRSGILECITHTMVS